MMGEIDAIVRFDPAMSIGAVGCPVETDFRLKLLLIREHTGNAYTSSLISRNIFPPQLYSHLDVRSVVRNQCTILLLVVLVKTPKMSFTFDR